MAQVALGKLSDFAADTMIPKSINGMSLLVCVTRDGIIGVLEDRCSHADVKLSKGSFEDGKVVCKAHGAKFDALTGKALCMPAVTPVKSFNTKVEGDTLFVEI